MRRRSKLCIVKTIIVIFVGATIALMLTSWFINPDTDSSKNISSKFMNQWKNWQQPHNLPIRSDDDNNLIVPSVNNLELAQRAHNHEVQKKDWHDRKAMAVDRERVGLGEQGEAAFLSEDDKSEEQRIFRQNGFSGLLSDRISLNRSLPDIRYKGCDSKTYVSQLPTVSVVIPFYNEHWSTLLRSVYSILNRSPPELINEIILVDDFSDKDFLGEKLDKYVADNLPKVKIVRLNERSGLITARLAGAKIAKAEVLIFLDSHIEANYNWLPPLLEPIAINPKTCVCPFIDVIDHDNFQYRAQDEGSRGAFDWEFYYKRLPLLPEDLIDRTRPFRSPIMAGGLFAIGTKFFWELGGYDEGLDIWGGEQYELSFKIWMCGGEMVDAPCSRIGHIYRGPMASKNPRKTDYVHKNYKRVAEVWMDEYAKYLYERNPRIYNSIDPGDLTEQKAIRKRLHCKSFKWFIKEIAFDLPKKYPPVEPPDYAHGAIQSLANKQLCLDTLNNRRGDEIGLYWCAEDLINPHGNQNWALSWHKDLRVRFKTDCLDVPTYSSNSKALIYSCHGQEGNQFWYYDRDKKWLVNGGNKRCMEANIKTRKIYVNDCDGLNINMKWNFGFVNNTALNHFYEKNFNLGDL